MAILTWYGHSCFSLDLGHGGSVVFDPYSPGSVPGVELPKGLKADLVLCSHQHGDHNAAGRVKLTGRKPAFRLTLLDSFHDPDKGAKRGLNQIAVVEYEGFRAVHLGDLGCALNRDQIDTLRKADLLMLPVGGFFTIGPDEAADICEQLQPRVIVPMHYRRGKMGFDVLMTLDDFTGKFLDYTELPENVLEIGPETSGLYVLNL
jgi:L-ascorbate metabolism protein UlaG (beta-lactamase superfamily)